MFTGIIESVGEVVKATQKGSLLKLDIGNPFRFSDVRMGSSLSVNGACLTVLDKRGDDESEIYSFEVSEETAKRTNMSILKLGSKVNLERPLSFNGRLEGHIVLGHVDGMVKISNIVEKSGGEKIFEFEYNPSLGEFFIDKGSCALNGISLTIFNPTRKSFSVSVLNYTFEKTNLKFLKRGDIVNCEVDVLGKYVKSFFGKAQGKTEIDLEFLKEHGFLN